LAQEDFSMPEPTMAPNPISHEEAYEIVKEAYVYAYPLILHYVSIRVSSNFARPTGIPAQAPFNQFSHARAFPPTDYRQIIRTNLDTLYSIALLDLEEPQVLSVPATDRYFMLPLLSLWTDVFAVPGTRTTGANTARDFLLVGPRWRGDSPAGVGIIRCPTRLVSIGGRTQTNGVADYDKVHEIQEGYKLTPLSSWGKGSYVPRGGKVDPSVDMKTAPPVQVDKMDTAAFFGKFAELLKDNPPSAFDYPMIHRLERTGFRVGESFDLDASESHIKSAFERGTADGKTLVARLGKKEAGAGSRGWVYSTRSGCYGVDYSYRAAIAYFALGQNLPQDAIYPSLTADAEGRPLHGSDNFVLIFERGKLPPVNAFWSLTAYDADGYFIPNAINRQALGDRDELQLNGDGSLSLHVQADSPGSNRESNWLPVAKAPFTLMLRLYSPKHEALDGTWIPPDIGRDTTAAKRVA
jgi:hypothetical protein